jgi:hypothetical protein
MSRTLCGWPDSVRAGLACLLVCVVAVILAVLASTACGAQAERLAAPSEAVPSQLLSDDERIDFCTQMHRAATPEQRRAVAARLHDTLTPRAQVQGVELPAWVKQGQPVNGDARLPGLSCDTGTARPRPQTPPAVLPTPARKPAVRDSTAAKPVPPREAAVHGPSGAQIPSRQSATQAASAAPAVPVAEAPARNTAAGDIPVEQDHGVAYVTGGVGQDEATAMRELASGYNMRATFTTRSGEYLSGVNVQISKADGTTVLTTTSDGPYLFARLPQGRYRLVASLDGVERSRELSIPAHGGVRFTLVWPSLRTSLTN